MPNFFEVLKTAFSRQKLIILL